MFWQSSLMAHSRDGAMAAMYCLWHGTAKDRKAIIKSFKTFIEKTCYEEFGHMVLMAIFDTVDDTKLVGKAVLGELAECLSKVSISKESWITNAKFYALCRLCRTNMG